MALLSPDSSLLVDREVSLLDDSSSVSKGHNRFWRRAVKEAKQIQKQKDGKLPAWGAATAIGGRHFCVDRPVEVAGTTDQICGLNPFIIPSGAPKVGVPIGSHQITDELVGLSPYHYMKAAITTNPNMFVVAQPGVGKSALLKRLLNGMSAMGHIPIILGDVKCEYPDVVRENGGQVIRFGPGLDKINLLDVGPIHEAARRLQAAGKDAVAKELFLKSDSRRLEFLSAICEIFAKRPLTKKEENVLAAALAEFTRTEKSDPILSDLYQLLLNPTPDIIDASNHDNGRDKALYLRHSDALLDIIRGLASGNALGGMFNDKTTTPLDLDAPAIEIDISSLTSIAASADDSVAAAMLAIWTYSFSAVEASLALSENGLISQRRYVAFFDELWRSLRGSARIVEQLDSLTRTNRTFAVSQVMTTHGSKDLAALSDEASIKKAKSLLQNSSIKVLGALTKEELEPLSGYVGGLSKAEMQLINSWSDSSYNYKSGRHHAGQGKFLIKMGNKPGIPIKVNLLPQELALYETTK